MGRGDCKKHIHLFFSFFLPRGEADISFSYWTFPAHRSTHALCEQPVNTAHVQGRSKHFQAPTEPWVCWWEQRCGEIRSSVSAVNGQRAEKQKVEHKHFNYKHYLPLKAIKPELISSAIKAPTSKFSLPVYPWFVCMWLELMGRFSKSKETTLGSAGRCRMISIPSDWTLLQLRFHSGSSPIIKGQYLLLQEVKITALCTHLDLSQICLMLPIDLFYKQMDNSDGPNGSFPNYRLGWLSILLQKHSGLNFR